MSYPRAGDAHPLHPDEYGSRARVLTMQRDDPFGALPEMTDAEMEAAWVREQEFRSEAAVSHLHGCGHACDSGACVVVKDHLCITCQLSEVSDKERHQAARRAREKSA